jgi:DNA-binding MarR family transcriptional regulator
MPLRSDDWQFFTNHTHVLVCLASDPDLRLRDIAARVGITERAAHDLVKDLERAGYVRVRRVGRRNRYEVCGQLPLRRSPFARHSADELISLLSTPGENGSEGVLAGD